MITSSHQIALYQHFYTKANQGTQRHPDLGEWQALQVAACLRMPPACLLATYCDTTVASKQ